MNIKEWE